MIEDKKPKIKVNNNFAQQLVCEENASPLAKYYQNLKNIRLIQKQNLYKSQNLERLKTTNSGIKSIMNELKST